MKYSLIKPINPSYSTIEQILTNRGIKYEEINHYLNTTNRDICSPELFGTDILQRAASILIQTIATNQLAIMIVDADCDGFTSAALLYNYLYDLFPQWTATHLQYNLHNGKQHGLNDQIQAILKQNPLLVLIPDAGSNDVTECNLLWENNIKTIILDHHECDVKNPHAYLINNQLSSYPNKNLAGVGVTWQFCRYIDKLLHTDYANNYLDLVALGNTSDMMSLTSFETKHLIQEGLKEENLKNPFMTYMIEKNRYSLGNIITSIGIAFYVAPFVNAIVRSGTQEEKQLVFESMLNNKAFLTVPSTKRGHKPGDTETIVQQAIRIATNVKARQTKAQDASLQLLETMIQDQNLLSHKVLLFLLEPGQIDRNIAGLVANKFMAKYQRPCCILTKVIESDPAVAPWDNAQSICSFQGSARGCDKVGVTQFKDICESTGVIMYATGRIGGQ